MEPGDHLVTRRYGYTHHGLLVSKSEVIHYSGFAYDKPTHGCIEVTSLREFCNGFDCWVKPHDPRTYTRKKSIERAYKRLGEDWYNLLVNNCEHFVNWCIDGKHRSDQINRALASASGVGLAHLAAGSALAPLARTPAIGKPVEVLAGALASRAPLMKSTSALKAVATLAGGPTLASSLVVATLVTTVSWGLKRLFK